MPASQNRHTLLVNFMSQLNLDLFYRDQQLIFPSSFFPHPPCQDGLVIIYSTGCLSSHSSLFFTSHRVRLPNGHHFYSHLSALIFLGPSSHRLYGILLLRLCGSIIVFNHCLIPSQLALKDETKAIAAQGKQTGSCPSWLATACTSLHCIRVLPLLVICMPIFGVHYVP